ncbi:expressed unknown protein [Seminavis robusta]|uniref:Silicon transporter n=1 Tax=Seminavis robusta TaxID=568900 RepID=A0A9N8HJH3_9STRA|nr:expressed unknown protein [Seminavis robusta]|eukprot:Sro692_g188110.1 n/a (562) ;mRNA; f:35577-37355
MDPSEYLSLSDTVKYGSIETNSTRDSSEDENSPSVSPTGTAFIDDHMAGVLTPRSVSDAANQALVAVRHLHDVTVLPVADEHGHLAHYPGEEIDQHQRQKLKRPSQAGKLLASCTSKFLEAFKCLYSMGILLLSIGSVMMAIFNKQTVATAHGVPTPVAFLIFWFLIVWLAKMEGGQACLVGLQPVDKSLYAHTHPRTLISTNEAHKGDNMERFIVGRQFLVCLVVFSSNLMAATIENPHVPGLSDSLTDILLTSGNAVTLIAIIIGQSAQINAANCMLDFINTWFMIVTTFLSLILDMSGILHSVYMFQILFCKITNTPIDSNEPPRTPAQNIFFWTRVAFSTSILCLSFAVTLAAVWNGKTTMYAGVPNYISMVLLFVLLTFVGIMEGMQIALFAVVNLPPSDLKGHPLAAKCCKLTFKGSNLQAFLIGRQMCVTLCMFIVARLTSCDVALDGSEHTIFGVSENVQSFFNTGMLGAFITTVIGSLVWRIIASCFPVPFLSNPLIYAIIRLCLTVEASGVCSAAWPLALVQKEFIFGYTLDEAYIGTPQDPLEEPLVVTV